MANKAFIYAVAFSLLLVAARRTEGGKYDPKQFRPGGRRAAFVEKYGPEAGETVVEGPVGENVEPGQVVEGPDVDGLADGPFSSGPFDAAYPEAFPGGGYSGGDCCYQEDQCCGVGPWAHRTGIFGEFLLLRPRNLEVAYAVPINGPIAPVLGNAIQIGATGIVDPDYSPGFRAGFVVALDDCSSVVATYSQLDTNTSNSISIDAPDVVRSLVTHPLDTNAATDVLQASAQYDVDFKIADVDFRALWWNGERHAINYLAGVRYAHLDQTFGSQFTDNGTTTVDTDINFDGAGIRVGLDGERHARNGGWLVYGRSMASFLAGQFQAQYSQFNNLQQTVVSTSWEAGRLVPILDMELGVGWTSPMGGFRLTAGYLVSAWFNAVKTDDYIHAVQTNNFIDLHHPFSYDGLTARAEFRF